MLLECITDALKDSRRLVPFLFRTYLAMETLEHHTGGKVQAKISRAGMSGPLWGGLLGVIPQCGISAAASSFYAGKVITIGTLLAVYLSTSDEMLPILLSEQVPGGAVVKILVIKVMIAIISGFAVELVYRRFFHHKKDNIDIHTICEEEHCSCEDGILKSAIRHTVVISAYIFAISAVLNVLIGLIGEDAIAGLFRNRIVVGEMIAALIGLIPNCASSVVITQLYLHHIIGPGAMMSGLLVNAGVGLLILFRLKHNLKRNLQTAGLLYGLGVFWGIVIELSGILGNLV